MRVGLVHSFYRSENPSGENLAVLAQAESLANLGYDVQLFSKSSDDLVSPRALINTALRVSTGIGQNPLEELSSFRPDVVHIHNLFPNWSDSWIRRANAPVVATVHNFRPLCAAGTLSRAAKACTACPTNGSHYSFIYGCYQGSRLKSIPLAISTRKSRTPALFKSASRLIFLSERALKTYKILGHDYSEKSSVVPNFLLPMPGENGLTEPDYTDSWFFVGRLSPEKGILELVKNWPANRILHVIGDGPLRQACALEARNRKIVFHGLVPNDRARRMISSGRGLIFPSTSRENSPLAFLEAISVGLPVISLLGNSVADDIERYGCGVTIRDLTQLDAAIEKIESEHARLAENARTTFQKVYSEQTWQRRIAEIYSLALAGTCN